MEVIIKIDLYEFPDIDDPDYDAILRECIAEVVNCGDFEIVDE